METKNDSYHSQHSQHRSSPNGICVLQVCPNNSQYNRANLRNLMSAIANTHSKCTVRVFDTLAHHTFVSTGHSVEESIALSKKRGQEWVKRYLRYQKRTEYSEVLSSHIMDWDGIKQLPSFDEKMALAHWAYDHTEVKTAIDQYVQRHLTRAVAEGRISTEIDLVRQCSRSYIMEELAGKAALVTDLDQHHPYEVFSGHNALDPALFNRVSQKHGIELRVHSYIKMDIEESVKEEVA